MGVRGEGESNPAISACNDFLRLGVGRSLRALLRVYLTARTSPNPSQPSQTPANPPISSVLGGISPLPPTKSIETLKDWAAKYNWNERASLFDLSWEEEKEAARKAVMDEGFGLDYERARGLKRLARLLESHIFEKSEIPSTSTLPEVESYQFHNLWCHDVKSIGVGEFAETVDTVKFNAALVSQWRGLLDEIAKETNGRRPSASVELFLKSVQKRLDYSRMSPAQIERVSRGEHPLVVLLEQYLLSDD